MKLTPTKQVNHRSMNQLLDLPRIRRKMLCQFPTIKSLIFKKLLAQLLAETCLSKHHSRINQVREVSKIIELRHLRSKKLAASITQYTRISKRLRHHMTT